MPDIEKRHKIDKKKELITFLKFSLIGLANTAIDWVVYSIFFYALGFQNFGAGLYLAQVLGFSAGVTNSYIMNRKITFQNHGKFFGPQLVKFLVVSLTAMAASLLTMFVLENLMGFGALIDSFAAAEQTLYKVLAQYALKAAASLLGIVVNYIGNRIWTFHE